MMVYQPSSIVPTVKFKDVRAGEVRKLLTSFNKEALVLIENNKINIIVDNMVLYWMYLKVELPPNINFPVTGFVSRDLLAIEEDDTLIHDVSVIDYVYPLVQSSMIRGELLAKKDNLVEDENYNKLLGLKSADGMDFYKLASPDFSKNFMIPVASGFPTINKNDNVTIEVYDYPVATQFLVDMTIFKKKFNRDIHMVFKILDI